MTADALSQPLNRAVSNGDLNHPLSDAAASNGNGKKAKEIERRRRRRKQKKNRRAASQANNNAASDVSDGEDDVNENIDAQKVVVEIEYVPEKAEIDEGMDEEFRKIFEKFTFKKADVEEEKKDEAQDGAAKKKAGSDSEEEELDDEQKEKGASNKKKKLLRRMNIAQLKQICARPDVVEVWDATAADPKLLVFLKSYRNTVPVPRHWCQKRKFLQGSGCGYHGAWTCRCLAKGALV